MLYKYYSKNDSKKEALALIEASSLGKAIEAAAHLKNLPLEDFIKLYEVVKYEYKKEKNA